MIKNLFYRSVMGLMALALCIALSWRTVDAQEIAWRPYAEGVEAARQEGKKMMLFFYSDWCNACKKMKNETFTDSSIIAYLNENFIPVRLDADKAQDVAEKYRVRWLPVTWFVGSDGEKISGRSGYITAKEMQSLLKYVHTDSYRQMSYSKFLKQQ